MIRKLNEGEHAHHEPRMSKPNLVAQPSTVERSVATAASLTCSSTNMKQKTTRVRLTDGENTTSARETKSR